ncbi:branched-chain amino acid ABC transporter permease [Petroclostridium sp. X23]|uniref:branched-chain amino acid ABC transporter permease n=1 Tax=Petroclostridium sp. X23 TaxID=3045146 RepID=UPI0024AD7352|nr:branched-chain amino acid ABC transporter permease [Petroclostridium sp. X23]WHH60921.1 branched-chain amino acid ABC transporter permease [Petroclostridium sp. X23]
MSIMTIFQLLINGILRGGVYGLLAIGLTITYGVARVLNFAHGEFVVLGMYSAYFMYMLYNIHPFVSTIFIIPIFFIFGLLMYGIMFKHLTKKSGFVQIFTTAGVSMVLQNLCQFFFSTDPRYIPMTAIRSVIRIGQLNINMSDLLGFIIAVFLMVILFTFLQYSFKGKGIRAVIDQQRGALLVGLNVDLMYRIAIALAFACIGAAGAVLATSYNTAPAVGGTWKSIAFIAVVLGGHSSLPGSLIAGLVIGLIESFVGYFGAVQLKEVAYFLLFFFVLVVKPQGLFGRKTIRIGR